jgi:hypothetical protein
MGGGRLSVTLFLSFFFQEKKPIVYSAEIAPPADSIPGGNFLRPFSLSLVREFLFLFRPVEIINIKENCQHVIYITSDCNDHQRQAPGGTTRNKNKVQPLGPIIIKIIKNGRRKQNYSAGLIEFCLCLSSPAKSHPSKSTDGRCAPTTTKRFHKN